MVRFDADDERLLAEAAAWPEMATLDDIERGKFTELARRRGLDFATALLYDRLRNSAVHGGLLDVDDSTASAELPEALSAEVGEWTWTIVPGAFHREYPETGADGAAILAEARRRGIRAHVVPTESFGPLATNAEILRQFLADRAGEPTVLISLSKGSLEVRRLLESDDADEVFGSVRAWINLTGLLSGSPLVSWLLKRPLRVAAIRAGFWWRGYDFNVVRELNRTAALADQAIRLPPNMEAIHVVGFPRERHLSSALLRRGHRRLSEHGPSDGAGIILADVVRWPGLIYPVWGADHYLRTSHDDLSSLTLRVLRRLGARTEAAQDLLPANGDRAPAAGSRT